MIYKVIYIIQNTHYNEIVHIGINKYISIICAEANNKCVSKWREKWEKTAMKNIGKKET